MEDWKRKTENKLDRFLKELEKVCSRCGRKVSDITVLFATKYINPECFVSFVDIYREINIVPVVIGENRVQEAGEKMKFVRENNPELPESFKIVMIGTLQTNKINKAIKLFDEIHSIDSLELAKALDTRLEREGKTMPVFLEVNVAEEESKHGFGIKEMETAIKSFMSLKSLKLEGLMTMAPYSEDPEKARPFFRKLRQLADKYGLQTSMGMSHDWKVAIEEGTDMIRIGGRIFG